MIITPKVIVIHTITATTTIDAMYAISLYIEKL